jgi:CheY-like chemotaxis protein
MAKILLVEDNEMNRDMLSRRLVRRGYEVAIALDGEQGVVHGPGGDARPDPDGHEPARAGRMEATRQLKAAPETRGIPVIALTAHAMSGDREKAIEAGCDDFDTKPVDLERLLGKIEALLKSKAGPVTTGPGALAHLRHELRTPLNHIMGYTELLLEDAGADGGSLASDLRRVLDDARAVLSIVNERLAPAGRMRRA